MRMQTATAATFGKVWIALLALTAVEVFLCYEQVPAITMLALLIGISVIKAALINAYFMHLKYDKAVLRRFFLTGILLAVFVYMIALLTFKLFASGVPH